ncbi:MAG: CsiV family protein [Methylacidiphilales bacterium]|nr:CsiV family protein [Candidatus Methylacidiphilales bacterium]
MKKYFYFFFTLAIISIPCMAADTNQLESTFYGKYVVFENVGNLDYRDIEENELHYCESSQQLPQNQIPQNQTTDTNPAPLNVNVEINQEFGPEIELFFNDFNHSLINLQKNTQYRLIDQFQWQVTMLGTETTELVKISSGMTMGGENRPIPDNSECLLVSEKNQLHELHGTVELVSGKYFHAFNNFQFSKITDQGLKIYNIQETRKISSDNLYYLDHPRFGILYKIISEKSIARKQKK